MGLGLPELNIYFKNAAETAVKRSGEGIVALILRDTTAISALSSPSAAYGKLADVSKSHYTTDNYDYISKTFLGSPKKVLVEIIGADENYEAALGRLKNKKWNYLSVPGIGTDDIAAVAEWIITQREAKKTFKAVLNYDKADSIAIINFATEGIVVGDKTYTAAEYCCRIAGLIAGLSFNDYERASATYATLSEVEAITESTDPDKDIGAGKLILVNDGSVIKIGRAVNSLQTVEENLTEDMKKIRIVEIMDLMSDDIKEAFASNYLGVYANSYDYKLLFVNEVTQYFKRLADSDILEREYDNTAFIDVDGQRKWLAERSDVSDLSDDEIKKAKTGSLVFVGANVLPLDAMEDLNMYITSN